MSSKSKKKPKKTSLKTKTFNWVRLVKRTLISFSFIAVIAIPFYFYSLKSTEEHDLSTLGNGRIATVVQIHDPSCALCNQLKRNVAAVKGDFTDKIQFKTANIKTNKGKYFANKYNAAKITLLFFDKKGKLTNTLQGVSSKKELKESFSTLSRSS